MIQALLWVYLVYTLYLLAFGIDAGCKNPLRIWRSRMSDQAFDLVTAQILRSANTEISDHWAAGGNHCAWIANGHFAFKLDGHGGQSYLQRRRFFKALREAEERRPHCRVRYLGERKHREASVGGHA